VPSLGQSHRLRGMTTGRIHHLLSDIECSLFYLLDWNDAVVDIREQFPLDRSATRRIAKEIGVSIRSMSRHERRWSRPRISSSTSLPQGAIALNPPIGRPSQHRCARVIVEPFP
jgi:hypothetical protein